MALLQWDRVVASWSCLPTSGPLGNLHHLPSALPLPQPQMRNQSANHHPPQLLLGVPKPGCSHPALCAFRPVQQERGGPPWLPRALPPPASSSSLLLAYLNHFLPSGHFYQHSVCSHDSHPQKQKTKPPLTPCSPQDSSLTPALHKLLGRIVQLNPLWSFWFSSPPSALCLPGDCLCLSSCGFSSVLPQPVSHSLCHERLPAPVSRPQPSSCFPPASLTAPFSIQCGLLPLPIP